MTLTSREKKASRITTACNPCRARKQKCSGERPRCEQCLKYGRPCAWPEQLKRGPAKGYIETLEHRLHETEHLLLKLLGHVSDDELSKILSEGKVTTSSISNPNSNSKSNTNLDVDQNQKNNLIIPPLSLSSTTRKTGAEYWKRFPLSSTESIRRWERDCYHHHHAGWTGGFSSGLCSSSAGAGDSIVRRDTDLSLSSIDDISSRGRGARTHIEDTAIEEPSVPSEQSPTKRQRTSLSDRRSVVQRESEQEPGMSDPVSSSSSSSDETSKGMIQQYQDLNRQAEDQNDLHTNGTVPCSVDGREYQVANRNTGTTPSQIVDSIYASTPTPTAPMELSSWIAAPPVKFQRQFLW
ncbi:transcriptional regulator family: Fungal Specific TF [Paecilomyces variotii]|nr:transcriptional regulator family: Fungal Specific TF [Paecilomyces variotii]KAJ9401600.1 transcriptional regulator family: Fungal Specific TF [Paecilomyces variotii]